MVIAAIKQPPGGTVMNKYSIGVDFHKKYSYFVVKDEKGKTLKSRQVINSKQEVENFLKDLNGEKRAVIESCRNWMVMHDWLEEIVDEVVLANPYKVKAIAEAKIKTDKIDANILADLLRADMIPRCWIADRKTRDLRNLLRERIYFVRLRTMTKNRITTVFDRYPDETRKMKAQTDLFGKAGREQLNNLPLRDADKAMIARELNFIDLVNTFIQETEEVIEENFEESKNVELLKSIPGIGKFFAPLIEAEIGDIKRFSNDKKFASYVGLVPSTYSSGGKTVQGDLIGGGNKYLRWAFIEAVKPAVVSDEWIAFEYEDAKKRMHKNKARVVIAKKLMRIAYDCLKENRKYKRFNKIELERLKIRRAS
jgi:transposase